MNSKTSIRNIVLSTIIILIGFIATFLQFGPLFSGKKLDQHDINQAAASKKEIIDYRNKTGEEALWTNRMFGGMPLYVTGANFNNNWAEKIAYKLRFLPRSADVIFLSFLCCFIMLVCFKVDPIIAGIGAIAYGFNTFNIVSTEAGHIFKILAIAYAPLVLAGLVLIFRKKYILGLGILTLSITLEIASRHYQITYYLAFFGGVFVIYSIIDYIIKKDWGHLAKSLALIVIASVVGLGPHISRLWSINDYNKFSTRGKRELTISSNPNETESVAKSGLDKDYAFSWSEGKWESLTLFIPGLYGGASGQALSNDSDLAKAMRKKRVPKKNVKAFVKRVPLYWGDQPMTAGPIYAGAVIGFLFIIFLVNIRKMNKYYWILGSGFLLLMIAWGNNLQWFNYTLFDHFPLFNKFRSVSMAITFTILAMVMLGTLGLNELIKQEPEERKKNLIISLISYVALILVIWIGTATFGSFKAAGDSGLLKSVPKWLYLEIVDARSSFLTGTVFRVLFFSCLSGVILFFLDDTFKRKAIILGSIVLIVVVDLATMNNKYLNSEDFVSPKKISKIKSSPANKTILKDKGQFRVLDLNNPFNNANTSYFHNSIGGYHGAKMRVFQDLIDFHISRNNQKALDMLNTKYLITQDGQHAIPRNTALGNAWFVSSIKVVENADEEIQYLGNESFNPKEIAVVDVSKFDVPLAKENTGKITLTSYEPNHLVYETKNASDGFAVFSEIYYPKGWNAYIDGVKSEYIKANYLLRAMNIPAGDHKVEFKFEPASFYTGEKIALVFSILLTLIVLGSLGFSGYKFFTGKEEDDNLLDTIPESSKLPEEDIQW